jgi:hypothetical protein
MIHINLSEKYNNDKLNNYLLKNNTEFNEYILNIGTMFLDLKLKNKDNEISRDNINFNICNIIDYYEDKIDKLKNEQEISKVKPNDNENDQVINHIDKKYNDIFSKLNNNVDTYDRSLIQNLNPIIKKVNDIDQSFFKFFNKFESGNVEKGNFGEKFINNYLYDKFSNCQIEDTHKSTSFGDLLFTHDNLKLLVESKNVSSIRKEDISKFYKDIEIRTKNDEINSALFISLNNCSLPNNSKFFSFEIKNKVPIVFINNVFNQTELIRISIILLNYITKFIENYTDNISVQNIINDLESSIHLINKQFEYIDNDKKLITKFQQNIVNKEKDLNQLLKIILDSIKSNKINTNEKFSDHTFEQLISLLKKEKEHNLNFKLNLKSIEKLNISKYTIKKFGGIKKITQFLENELKKDNYILL